MELILCRLGRRLCRRGFALVTGALLVHVGEVVVVTDLSVGIFGLDLGGVSSEPRLGCDRWWFRALVGLTGGEFGGGAFGGGPGRRGVGVPGCPGLLCFG